jgi:DNA processing protein
MVLGETELRAWLRLSRLELTARAANALVDRFGSPEAVFEASEEQLTKVSELTDKGREKVLRPPSAAIDNDIGLLEKLEATIVPVNHHLYPVMLGQIFDPPVVLYVRGNLAERDKMAMGIVGSRRANIYGRSIAERIARDLAGAGLTIVSGGARGIDTSAHRGGLRAGGRTVAVLGCGIDVKYPPENAKLFDSICESGAVVSEFPLGSTPEPWRFPPRNRVISGMALGVLVCQSPEASGALITAGYAAEQGRDVYAVPGNVDDERNTGCHKLIKDGAKLVECAEDILEELGVSSDETAGPRQMTLDLSALTIDEQRVASLLSLEPVSVDTIIEKTGMPAPLVSGTLTILEMKSVIKRVPGNGYVRVI